MFLLTAAMSQPVYAEYDVKQMTDTENGGWAYKTMDEQFSVVDGDCTIKWNAVFYKEHGQSLNLQQDCPRPFEEQVPIHRAILTKINEQWPITEFEGFGHGGFVHGLDREWSVAVAVASSKSDDYADFRKNYPNSRYTSLNAIFVKLFNQAKPHQALDDLFGEFGAMVSLKGVEKVFTQKVAETPIHEELQAHGLSDKTSVIYDVGLSHFSIKPKQAD